MCVHYCAQLSYTTKHQTVLIIFLLYFQKITVSQMLCTGGRKPIIKN